MKKYVFICAVLCLSVIYGSSFADEGLVLIGEGQYFSVYAYAGLDVSSLLSKLNFNYYLQPEAVTLGNTGAAKGLLERTFDALYAQVSDVLDIHVYSFHGTIKIYPDASYVAAIYARISGAQFKERSFFYTEKNTIYISYPDLTLGMLGHEIAHAVISSFFVVPPPPKVQEILCGYVEYSLRKATGTLR